MTIEQGLLLIASAIFYLAGVTGVDGQGKFGFKMSFMLIATVVVLGIK